MTTMPRSQLFETMAWGPAPESAGRARRGSTGKAACSATSSTARCASRADGARFATVNPANGVAARAGGAGLRAGRGRGGAPPRARAQPGWWALGGHGRARQLYALAREVQRNSRLFAGGGVARQRQADPRVARHRHPARRPALLPPRRLGAADGQRAGGLRAGGRRGADHPVELPAADAGVEDRAGAGDGEHGRHEARRVHAAHRAALRASCCARRGCPPASSTSSPATARPAPALVDHPGVDKIAFTGSTEVGRLIRVATAGSGKKLSLELGGKSPFLVFDDADLDSVVEGRGGRDLVQPGAGLLRRVAHPGAGEHRAAAG